MSSRQSCRQLQEHILLLHLPRAARAGRTHAGQPQGPLVHGPVDRGNFRPVPVALLAPASPCMAPSPAAVAVAAAVNLPAAAGGLSAAAHSAQPCSTHWYTDALGSGRLACSQCKCMPATCSTSRGLHHAAAALCNSSAFWPCRCCHGHARQPATNETGTTCCQADLAGRHCIGHAVVEGDLLPGSRDGQRAPLQHAWPHSCVALGHCHLQHHAGRHQPSG